jgi:hypothetical protein
MLEVVIIGHVFGINSRDYYFMLTSNDERFWNFITIILQIWIVLFAKGFFKTTLGPQS